jgi:hypothetical protein
MDFQSIALPTELPALKFLHKKELHEVSCCAFLRTPTPLQPNNNFTITVFHSSLVIVRVSSIQTMKLVPTNFHLSYIQQAGFARKLKMSYTILEVINNIH